MASAYACCPAARTGRSRPRAPTEAGTANAAGRTDIAIEPIVSPLRDPVAPATPSLQRHVAPAPRRAGPAGSTRDGPAGPFRGRWPPFRRIAPLPILGVKPLPLDR